MRWFIVRLADGVVPAFVVAECPDETWSRDSLHVAGNAVVLSDEELRLDPDLSPVLDAWIQRDDAGYLAFIADRDAETTITEASMELGWDGPAPAMPKSTAGKDERRSELEEDLRRFADGVGVEAGGSWFVGLDLWERLEVVERMQGIRNSTKVARSLARELGSYAHRHDGVRPL